MNTYVFTSGSSVFVSYIKKALNIRVLYRDKHLPEEVPKEVETLSDHPSNTTVRAFPCRCLEAIFQICFCNIIVYKIGSYKRKF